MLEEGEYYSPSEELMFSYINSTMSNSKTKKKIMMANKKRFSDEQVKSLESIFENETKLEPKKKVQLARELGLEPRQVAIWFQNKRARYKSKKLESDYSILMANYNALASQFDSLNKEKHHLLLQVQKLRDLAGKGEKQVGEANSNYINRKSDEKYTEINKLRDDHDRDHDNDETKQEFSIEGAGSEYGASSILSDEDSISEIANFGYNEMNQIMKMADPIVTVDQSNCNLDDDLRSNGLFDDQLPVDNCQWWDFWS